jgi:ATP-binding cassette subfamily F protein 3
MIIVSVEGVRKHYGPEPVLNGVTFEVRPGQRIGLVGPNGTGKTTLLRILAGREDADGGACLWHPSVRFGYLEQQPEFLPGRTLWDEAHSALDELLAMQQEALHVAEALAHVNDDTEHQRLAARYDHLQQELQRHDAYNLDYKTERVLDGLRFPKSTFRQPVESLSGGEQNRLMLAKLLLAEPDLMLLDEPSNHLDIEATEWLEEFLLSSGAAMLLVSHDRYFLDKVTNRTLELFRGTVDSYVGNFAAYWQQKQERLLVQRRTYDKQREEIAKAEDFIRRNSYGQKSLQAEDRRKKLARIELIEPPKEIETPYMKFAEAQRSGDFVLRARALSKAFERPLFREVTFDVQRGQRFSLLGPNGSGKTTLLKCLLGLIPADTGQIVLGQGVEVGYFDQQLAGLSDDMPVVDAVRPPKKEFVEQQRRDLLARFGITGDTALQKVGQLSGGERCRTALARLAATDANLLVLDEPTNHLDLWARDSLERALNQFQGTILFVSHDRYFVDRVADHLLIIEPGGVRVFDGNYSEYQRFLQEKDKPVEEPAPLKSTKPGHHKPGTAKSAKHPAAHGKRRDKGTEGQRGKAKGQPATEDAAAPGKPAGKKRHFPFRKVVEIEAEVHDRESRLKQIHEELAFPETHRDGDRVRQLTAEAEEIAQKLKYLYAHWEEASELNW